MRGEYFADHGILVLVAIISPSMPTAACGAKGVVYGRLLHTEHAIPNFPFRTDYTLRFGG